MSLIRTAVVTLLMLSSMAILNYSHSINDMHLSNSLSTFPRNLGQWIGKMDRFDQKVYDVLGVDDSLLCHFIDPYGRSVELYVGFYRNQREGKIIHSPKNCMPGAGWNIVESSLEHIPLPGGNPDRADAIKLILAKGIQKQVVLYWYQSRGRIVASEYLERVYLVIDALNMHRTDASFVRLMAPVSNDDTGATARYLNEFAQLLIPALQEFIPGRTANGSQISSLSLLESGL